MNSSFLGRILDPDVLVFVVAAVVTVVIGVVVIVKTVARHRERMALIGMGIDPDSPSDSLRGQPRSGLSGPGYPSTGSSAPGDSLGPPGGR